MRNGYPIRSNLSSEHVTPARERRHLARAEFGIYRPVTPECAELLVNVLKKVEAKANGYLEDKAGQPATFRPQKDLGVTYLEQYAVRRALKHRQINEHGTQRVVHGVQDQNYKSPHSEVGVDLLGFSWSGGGERKLTGQIEVYDHSDVTPDSCFDDSAERLAYDSREITRLLHDIGATSLAESVRVPEHVSMFTYRSSMPAYVQEEHKRAISDLAYNEFSRENITSIALSDVVVGNGYSRPLELMS